MNFDGIWEGMVAVFFAACILCAALGALAMWLLPKVWAWFKPILIGWLS
jgi:hypothetical protein